MGAMYASSDQERLVLSKKLIDSFASILGRPDGIEIKDDKNGGGRTDCESFIQINSSDPCTYLVAEHELSHWLFGSDTVLAQDVVNTAVAKMLNQAGIDPRSQEALPYKSRLGSLAHGLHNILEDHRVAGLWGEVYPGGEDLLRRRWRLLAREIPSDRQRRDVLAYLQASIFGLHVQDPPDDFKFCLAPFQKYMNLVEGVDNTACLALTYKLLMELIDALIAMLPPPQPPQQNQPGSIKRAKNSPSARAKKKAGPSKGDSSKSKSNSGGSSKKKTAAPPAPKKQRPRKYKKSRQKDAQDALNRLNNLTPRKDPGKSPVDPHAMGAADVQSTKTSRHQKVLVSRVTRADDTVRNDQGETELEQLMSAGAAEMQQKIDAAKELLRKKDTPEAERENVLSSWASQAGIQRHAIDPVKGLVPASEASQAFRRKIENLRMKKRRKKTHHGNLDPAALIQAIGAGELGAPLFRQTKKTVEFEMMFLCDVSGSMAEGSLRIADQALSDAANAVLGLKAKVVVWAYSSEIYTFNRVGALSGAPFRMHLTYSTKALDMAGKWAREDPTKRAILHITDGLPNVCREVNSTGSPLEDLANITREIEAKGTPVSTLVIKHRSVPLAKAVGAFDNALGPGKYGLVTDISNLAPACLAAANDLAVGRLRKIR